MGAEDANKEVVKEDAVTKDVSGKADDSIAKHRHHCSENSSEKLTILERS